MYNLIPKQQPSPRPSPRVRQATSRSGLLWRGALTGALVFVVCALLLQPTQLRIGDAIGRAPDPIGQRWRLYLRSSRPAPEVAHVSDGVIIVEPWDQVKSG